MGALLVACGGLLAWYFRSALSRPPGDASPLAAVARSPGKSRAAQVPPATEDANRFEFYEMLPDAEVEVAEQANPARPAAPPPVSRPGTYVIQAGAFPNFADADTVKARLALLGVVSVIQTAQANGGVFHRVRIGPIENLNEINRLRARLGQNGIEYQVIPVGE